MPRRGQCSTFHMCAVNSVDQLAHRAPQGSIRTRTTLLQPFDGRVHLVGELPFQLCPIDSAAAFRIFIGALQLSSPTVSHDGGALYPAYARYELQRYARSRFNRSVTCSGVGFRNPLASSARPFLSSPSPAIRNGFRWMYVLRHTPRSRPQRGHLETGLARANPLGRGAH